MGRHRARGLDRDLGTLCLNGAGRVRWFFVLATWRLLLWDRWVR